MIPQSPDPGQKPPDHKYLLNQKMRPRDWVLIGALLALPFGTALLLETTRRNPDGDQSRLMTTNRLKQLAIGMSDWGESLRKDHFPPAAIYDKEGEPLLSWRVGILPYVEQKPLYKQFHLDEPWDSKHNLSLLEKMPKVFQSPKRPNGANTHFRVFHGPGAAFEGKQGLNREFPDGTSNTIMIVEADEAVPWTKPDELEYDPAQPLPKMGGIWPQNRFQLAMCDGSVRSAPATIEQTLHSAISRNGGEILGTDW